MTDLSFECAANVSEIRCLYLFSDVVQSQHETCVEYCSFIIIALIKNINFPFFSHGMQLANDPINSRKTKSCLVLLFSLSFKKLFQKKQHDFCFISSLSIRDMLLGTSDVHSYVWKH